MENIDDDDAADGTSLRSSVLESDDVYCRESLGGLCILPLSMLPLSAKSASQLLPPRAPKSSKLLGDAASRSWRAGGNASECD